MKQVKKYILLTLIVGFLCILSLSKGYSITSTLGSFDGHTNPFNVTFNDISDNKNQNQTATLIYPTYSYAYNATFSMVMYNMTCYSNGAYESPYCPNTTDVSSPIYDNPGSWHNPSYIYDGDWDTYGYVDDNSARTLYLNYSKPVNANKLYWKVKDSNGITDILIPNNCTIAYKNRVRLQIVSDDANNQVKYYCRTNESDTNLLLIDSSTPYIFETGMLYYYNCSNISVYVDNNTLMQQEERCIGVLKTLTLNSTYINQHLANGIGTYNLTFSAQGLMNYSLTVNLTNATYSYGIDNCSNSFGIPSNATTINLSFRNTNNISNLVNLTLYFNYSIYNLTYYYYNQISDIANTILCIYPNTSQSINVPTMTVHYVDSTGHYYYNSPFILTNITQYLTLYTQLGTSTVTYTIKDMSTKKLLANVLIIEYRFINNQWTVMESKYSDSTGRVTFNYVPYTEYIFSFTTSDYNQYITEPQPLSFSTYDIFLTKTTIVSTSDQYERLIISYTPKIYNYGTNNFTFTILSPLNKLTSYGYNLNYMSGQVADTGSSAAGEIFTDTITITPSSNFDYVTLNYYYVTTTSDTNITLRFPIIISNGTYSNNTMMGTSQSDPTYGLGLFERMIVMVLMNVFVVGIAALIGQVMPGFLLALLFNLYLLQISFIPMWMLLLPAFIGLFIISKFSGGY